MPSGKHIAVEVFLSFAFAVIFILPFFIATNTVSNL